ncbi:MAG: hypothetical protein ABI821_11185 [Pseudomonadota bacterium]
MKHWYSRPVCYVRDTPASLAFFVEKLGFSLDWNHEEDGRVFISLDDAQAKALKSDIESWSVPVRETHWGMPVIEILDLDNNELFFSPPG